MGPGRWARTVAAARRRENAMTSSTAPPTSLPMEAPRGKTPRRYVDRRATALLEEVRPPPSAAGLAVPRALRLRSRANIPELLVARDPLRGHHPLAHQLARRSPGPLALLVAGGHL